MEMSKVKSALQDLIIRLQDAEKGYKELEKATSIPSFKSWLNRYANERHNMHRKLESMVSLMGGDADVHTSFLGDLHRMFIDLKINNTSSDEQFDAIVTEINRGATKLIDDYEDVLSDVEMPANVIAELNSQKATVEVELNELKTLKKELDAVEA